MKRFIIGVGFLLIFSTGAVFSQDEVVSSVRKAAIKKMQSKLGNLRGSLKKDSVDVFLTENMIDKLKPIRPGDHLAAQQKAPDYAAPNFKVSTPDIETIPAAKDKRARNLYNAAGYSQDDQS